MEGEIVIHRKQRGEDEYRTSSIRALDRIAKENNFSRNERINLFLEYGIQHYEIVE